MLWLEQVKMTSVHGGRTATVLLMATAAAGILTSCSNSGAQTLSSSPKPEHITTIDKGESQRSAAPVTLQAGARSHLLRIASHVVYTFSRDRSNRSVCYVECVRAWMPVIAAGGKPGATAAVGIGSVGSIQRNDGVLQVTYDGHPLYYPTTARVARDRSAFGGSWRTVRVNHTQRED